MIDHDAVDASTINVNVIASGPQDQEFDPWQWRLPSGRTLAEASAKELITVGRVLTELGFRKERQAVVQMTRTSDGVYQVTIDGRVVGEVRRAVEGGWYAIDIDNRPYYGRGAYNTPHGMFKTRADAKDALVREFA